MISGDQNGRSWTMLAANGQLAGLVACSEPWGPVRLKADRFTTFFITPLCGAAAAADGIVIVRTAMLVPYQIIHTCDSKAHCVYAGNKLCTSTANEIAHNIKTSRCFMQR